jgi:hypothetical protein
VKRQLTDAQLAVIDAARWIVRDGIRPPARDSLDVLFLTVAELDRLERGPRRVCAECGLVFHANRPRKRPDTVNDFCGPRCGTNFRARAYRAKHPRKP